MKHFLSRISVAVMVFTVLFFAACTSESERFSEAYNLYDAGKYAEAAKVYAKIKDNKKAEEYKKKCELLASYQNDEAVKKLVSGYVSEVKSSGRRDLTTFKKISWSSLSYKEKKEALEDPVSFLNYAVKYAKGKGDVEIVAAMRPYFESGFKLTDLVFFDDDVDSYIEELMALTVLYGNNPKLFEICEKNGGIIIKEKTGNGNYITSQPKMTGFSEWIEDKNNAEALNCLGRTVSTGKIASNENMTWNRESISEYLNAEDTKNNLYSKPEKKTFIFINEDGSKDDETRSQSDAFEKAWDFKAVTDPNMAQVLIYYKLTYKEAKYVADNGNSILIEAGNFNYTAVDALTGEELAGLTLKPKLKDVERETGTRDKYYRYASLDELGENEEFKEFTEKIESKVKK